MQRVLIHPAGGPIELEVELIGANRPGARLIACRHVLHEERPEAVQDAAVDCLSRLSPVPQ